MPKRWCADCRQLFDLDSTRTTRCPPCQLKHDTQRNARASTASRGYDAAHQRLRAQLLEQWQPGQPCALCGGPTWQRDALDLAHNEDRSGYKGLAHASCNRATNTGR